MRSFQAMFVYSLSGCVETKGEVLLGEIEKNHLRGFAMSGAVREEALPIEPPVVDHTYQRSPSETDSDPLAASKFAYRVVGTVSRVSLNKSLSKSGKSDLKGIAESSSLARADETKLLRLAGGEIINLVRVSDGEDAKRGAETVQAGDGVALKFGKREIFNLAGGDSDTDDDGDSVDEAVAGQIFVTQTVTESVDGDGDDDISVSTLIEKISDFLKQLVDASEE